MSIAPNFGYSLVEMFSNRRYLV